jgi:hypothetical protein
MTDNGGHRNVCRGRLHLEVTCTFEINIERHFNEDVLAARILEDMKLWSLARLGGIVGVDDPG